MKKIVMAVLVLAFLTSFDIPTDLYEYVQDHQYQMQQFGDPICC